MQWKVLHPAEASVEGSFGVLSLSPESSAVLDRQAKFEEEMERD